MKVVYVSNFFNHHQKPLSECLFKLTEGSYWFIGTGKMSDEQKSLGYEDMNAPYVLNYSKDNKEKIDQIIMEADVVQFGEAPLKLIKNRIRAKKIVVRDDECRYKSILKFLKWPIYTYNSFYFNKGFFLCASAFGPIDYLLSGMKPSKCYKWGYFPELKKYNDIQYLIEDKGNPNKVTILWAGRHISLKHPESVIYVAEKLKEKGYLFDLNIIGIGPMTKKIELLIKKKGLLEKIHLLGSMSPTNVRKYMEKSDIFIFTSDRNEGWGAVLNESLNSACAVVAGNNIGSVPYLLKDGENGLIFRDQNWRDLVEKLEWLILHPSERKEMGKQAYLTMLNTWNADNASKNLIKLYEALLNHEDTPIIEGPCSKAPMMFRKIGKFKTL